MSHLKEGVLYRAVEVLACVEACVLLLYHTRQDAREARVIGLIFCKWSCEGMLGEVRVVGLGRRYRRK